jgi:hypothetical protein
MNDQRILELFKISRGHIIYIKLIGSYSNFSSLYVRDIFLSGSYESFLNLYVVDIFLSGSLMTFLYVDDIL